MIIRLSQLKGMLVLSILIVFGCLTSMPVRAEVKIPGGLLDDHPNGAIVSSIEMQSDLRLTGTAPFDSVEGPGNDTSATDNVVRTFDTVIYNVKSTFSINSDNPINYNILSYTGGTLHVKCVVPNTSATNDNKVRWDKESLGLGAKNVVLSADGLTLTFDYVLEQSTVTVPGNRTLPIPLFVSKAGNGTVIIPTFTTSLTGNTVEQAKIVTDSPVTVSASSSYNIELMRNGYLANKVSVPVDGETVIGRMYGYGITVQLDNSGATINKGLKGVEVPVGGFTFDLDYLVQKEVVKGSGVLTDVTSTLKPILWNYKISNTSLFGNIAGRTMNFGSNSYTPACVAPYGKGTNYLTCYDSGVVTAAENRDEHKSTFTVNDYLFNPNNTFPTHRVGYDNTIHARQYPESVGCFFSGYVEILVPLPENLNENSNYYLTVKDQNMKVTTQEGTIVTNQVKGNDDMAKVQHVLVKGGSYAAYNRFYGLTTGQLSTSYGAGDSWTVKGGIIRGVFFILPGTSNDPDADVHSYDALCKFDDEALEPTSVNGKYVTMDNGTTPRVLFGALKIGSVRMAADGGWLSDNDMEKSYERDFDYFATLDELKAQNRVCTAVMLESREGVITNTGSVYSYVNFQVKNSSVIGNVYQMTTQVNFWYNQLDVDAQTHLNSSSIYPPPNVTYLPTSYVKTEYVNGQIKDGTHNGYNLGNSLLIVGGNLSITNSVEQKSGTVPKTNFDLSQSKFDVHYAVTPTASTGRTYNASAEQLIDVTVTDTLPVGLKYKIGSAILGGTYSVSANNGNGGVTGGTSRAPDTMTTNADGSTTITWNLKNVPVDKTMSTIHFTAMINQKTPNGTSFETKAVISSLNDFDPRIESLKTKSCGITVSVPLASRLYKTVDKSETEIGESFNYTLNYRNMSSLPVNGVKLFDILPYNGDGRGSDLEGTYQLKTIDAVVNGDVANSGVEIYYTNDVGVRSKTSETVTLEGNNWVKVGSGETIDSQATAVLVVGQIGGLTDLDVMVGVSSNDSQPGDLYQNDATITANGWESPIQAVPVKVAVVGRALSGRIWFDFNKNGAYDSGEHLLNDTAIRLVDDQGNAATDILGNPVSAITTDTTGTYRIENLKAGTYQVVFDADAVKYGTTDYLKSGVAIENDSNAVVKTINGQTALAVENIVMATADTLPEYDYELKNQDCGLVWNKSMGDINISKSISAGSIDFSQGNPTFIYKILGDNGEVFYTTIEFTQADLANKDFFGNITKSVAKSATYDGWYTVTEEKSMRYDVSTMIGVSGEYDNGTKQVRCFYGTNGVDDYTQTDIKVIGFKTNSDYKSNTDFVLNNIKAK